MTEINQDIGAGDLSSVIDQGYCIGCGVCAAMDPSIEINLDSEGRYLAKLPVINKPNDKALRSCPFVDGVSNEDQLSKEVFGTQNSLNPYAGYHIASFAGWVEESNYRQIGSSGGLANWLLVELLEKGLVDHVVNVAPSPNDQTGSPLFNYSVSSNASELRQNSKSRYYPVEMSEVVSQMIQTPGRYAVIGIPCFIKALRLASKESSELKERLTFAVGIVCGHLKSTGFAESLAWQCGVEPDQISTLDFRTKLEDRPASKYGMTVEGTSNAGPIKVTRPMTELFGGLWGHGFFKYKACDFCDDVLAETADVVFGDAWLPEYANDSSGTNVVVVRNQAILRLLQAAVEKRSIHLDKIPIDKVIESQAGGFRHRRDGLAYRLWLKDQNGRWRPKKRVAPAWKHLSRKLRRIYRRRIELAETSHSSFALAKKNKDLDIFLRTMKPLVKSYDREYLRPMVLRLFGKIRRLFIKKI